MNKIMKRIAYILSAAALLFACTPEEINHPKESEAPQTATAFTPTISVDQETNQVTFSLDQAGYVPVWVFQDGKGEWADYKTGDGFKKIYPAAGDYSVRMYVSNAAGITPDYVEESFHIDNTIVNFDRYIRYLSGGSSRVWRIDNSAAAHQACGESVENASGWWAAKADEKAGTGLYDNRLTFTSEGVYCFDPGTAGTVYVNAGVTVEPYASSSNGDGQDYTAPVAAQEASYSFKVEGDAVYLVLPAGSLFPYIPNNEFVTDTKFRIISIDNNAMTLVWYTATGNNGGPIAWQFILTSKAGAYVFNGFDYNADCNLWKRVDAADAHSYSFYYAPGWGQIADPAVELSNGTYNVTLPSATSDQWQAQMHIIPNDALALSADLHYDFSAVISTNKELPGMTLKLTDAADDGNFLFVERVKIPAGNDFIFYLSDLQGITSGAVKLALDFGGNAEGTEVSISRITLKDHAIDDGTVLPDEGGEGGDESGANFDITGETNLWRKATIESMSYYYAPGWSQIADPGFTSNNFVYVVTLPESTSDQWQAQVAFHTDMSSSAAKKYDFCCTLNSTNDHPGVTIKLVKEGDDGSFYFADRHKLKANEDYVYKVANLDGIDMEKIALFFDFGGCTAGTEVEIKDICFQEHQEAAGDTPGTEIWPAADAFTLSYYYAPGWSQIEDPKCVISGDKFTWTLPAATSDQWQAQVFLVPTSEIALSASKKYDFSCKLESSKDLGKATVKLHKLNADGSADDNTSLVMETPALQAYTEKTINLKNIDGIDAPNIRLVLDFGGNAADTEISISGISLKEK